jgi:hypothetical protein
MLNICGIIGKLLGKQKIKMTHRAIKETNNFLNLAKENAGHLPQ